MPVKIDAAEPLINCLLRMTGIARMSRRRAKCIVSIAGIGRGFSDLLLTRGPAPDTGALWSDVEGHGPGRSTSLRPAAAPDFFRFRVNFW